jgi:hypothetical protein
VAALGTAEISLPNECHMISGRAAVAMILRHGSNAVTEAAKRADEFFERGDLKGGAAWLCILMAIEQLQAEKPAPGEKMQ